MMASFYHSKPPPLPAPASISLPSRGEVARGGSRAPDRAVGRAGGHTPGFSDGDSSGLASNAQHTVASPRIKLAGRSRSGVYYRAYCPVLSNFERHPLATPRLLQRGRTPRSSPRGTPHDTQHKHAPWENRSVATS